MAPAEMKTRLSATQGNREGAADERAAPSQDACPLPSPQADGRPHSSAAVHQLPQRPATAIRPLNTANQLHHERGAAPWGVVLRRSLSRTYPFLSSASLPASAFPPPSPQLHAVFVKRPRWLCVLPGWQLNVNVNVREKAATALDQFFPASGGRGGVQTFCSPFSYTN